jgi:LacI family transcriptional regulator
MSKPTISRAMRARVAQIVEQLVVELGSAPETSPQRSSLIALVHDDATRHLALEAQRGVLAAIRDTDFALVVRSVDRAAPGIEQELHRFLDTQRPAGVLLMPGVAELEPVLRACRATGCDYVRMAASALDEPARLVAANEREAAADAIGHLIALGHRRIGIVAGPDELGSAQQRELGYLDAMADHELDRGPALVASGDYSFESGVAAGKLLLEVSPRPTAIFAASDAMAAGVLHAARDKGIDVPTDLSIVGFEDAPIAAQLWPPLTTVRVPVAAMAQAAARKLLDPEAAPDEPMQFRLELVPRASTAPPAT